MDRVQDPIPDHRLSLSAITEALTVIDPVFLDTPQLESEPLSAALGCRLLLKVETINPIRSFKGRGADFFVTKVTEGGEQRLMVCASTGNFGQAMAYSCRRHGRALVVYAEVNANPLKIGRIRDWGAEVRLAGNDFDAAKESARRFCDETGAWLVEDGREPEISEGAGTIAVEVLYRAQPEVMLVPVGNGALINGVGRWLKASAPGTTLIGVSASGADAMQQSWRQGRVVVRRSVETIAEGIAVRVPVPEAVKDMERIIDDMLAVDDDRMLAAARLVLDTTGLLVEPAGAVGVAAIMDDPGRFEDRQVATILTGSNVTPEQRRAWLG